MCTIGSSAAMRREYELRWVSLGRVAPPSGYVAAMRREYEQSDSDVLMPECGHDAARIETQFGESHPAWFVDRDGNVRCCHPDCAEQDWAGDFIDDSDHDDYLNSSEWTRYFYGDN